jgi:hypothetical protein
MVKSKTKSKNRRNHKRKITIFDLKTVHSGKDSQVYGAVIEAGAGQRLFKLLGVKTTEVTRNLVVKKQLDFVSRRVLPTI